MVKNTQNAQTYHTEYWYNAFIKTCFNDRIEKNLLFGFIPIGTININFDFPVDLVYLWVNGNDEQWKAKKQYWHKEIKNIDFQAINNGRFVDNEELRYSLRSVEKFIPWINHIYIITDDQIPEWLDINNKKISIVFHKDIIPEKNLPLFNSEAIETYIPNIPDLTEHFLYGCDDFYFGKELKKSFFFMPDGRPIIRFNSQIKNKYLETSMYARSILKMQSLVKEHFGKNYPFEPHHNIDAYRKKDFIDCLEFFKKDFENTRSHKFRFEGDIQRVVIAYYTLAKGLSVFKKNSNVNKFFSPIKRLILKLKKRFERDSIVMMMYSKNQYEILLNFKPGLFCTNDGENINNLDRLRTKIFLETTFPDKSSFELYDTELGKLNKSE